MRLLIIIFLLTLFYSCKNQNQHDSRPLLDAKILVGEWRLDSSSNRFFSYDRLIVLEDSSFYLFSGSDGGSLLTKGKIFKKDSVTTDGFGDWSYALIDSNHFQLSGGWTNDENFYKRTIYENYHDELKEYLQQDSFRTKVIGWWKLVSKQTPVKLINYHGFYDKFTLNIRPDGNAVFYLENKLDSTADYSYHLYRNGINFSRLCVGAECVTTIDSEGRMKLVLDSRMGDTLLLERLADIK